MLPGTPKPLQKANNIEDVYLAVRKRPLSIDELDQFYRKTDDARSTEEVARISLSKKIEKFSRAGENGHFLFVGYRGCGKSTELNKMVQEMDGNFSVLNFSLENELDPFNLNYIEFFIVTMQMLFEHAQKNNLEITEGTLSRIEKWSVTTELLEVTDKHIGAELKAELTAGAGLPQIPKFPLLFKFLAALKAAAKTSISFKETVKRNIEPRLSDLIELCNTLISDIRMAVNKQHAKDLVIVIENIDKVMPERAKHLFFDYGNQLVKLNCLVVYTFPIALYYHSDFEPVKNYFADTILLPMIKVTNKDGSKNEAGIQALTDVVDARINATLFQDPNLVKRFILASGGLIRDLFTLIEDAAEYAEYKGRPAMNEADFLNAFQKLKNEYRSTIADYTDDKGNTITEDEQYAALEQLMDTPDKRPTGGRIMLLLRKNLYVLSYNGEGWCDVHPVLKEEVSQRKNARGTGNSATA